MFVGDLFMNLTSEEKQTNKKQLLFKDARVLANISVCLVANVLRASKAQ